MTDVKKVFFLHACIHWKLILNQYIFKALFQVTNHLIFNDDGDQKVTLSNFTRGLFLIKEHSASSLIVQLPSYSNSHTSN